ncbi:MAG: HEAT repeat domain-containing protein [Anaerolineales bacterium]|nr:HEAT repeat domain-containing protein [Anaerolineales bacterium]
MNEIPLENVIQSLLDVDTPVNPRVLNRLSDLEPNELEQLRFIWEQLPLWRRKALMEDIEELGAHDFLLDFMALGQLALEDRDPGVRLLAVHTLWEYEQTELIHTFLNLIQQDQDCDVRAAAATGLQPVHLCRRNRRNPGCPARGDRRHPIKTDRRGRG